MNSYNYDCVNAMSFEEERKKPVRNSIGDAEKKNTHMYLKLFLLILLMLCIAIRLGD